MPDTSSFKIGEVYPYASTSESGTPDIHNSSRRLYYCGRLIKPYKDSFAYTAFSDSVWNLLGQNNIDQEYHFVDEIEILERKILLSDEHIKSIRAAISCLKKSLELEYAIHTYSAEQEMISDVHDIVSQGIPITENWEKARRLYKKFTGR